jgi:hypothetical protein
MIASCLSHSKQGSLRYYISTYTNLLAVHSGLEQCLDDLWMLVDLTRIFPKGVCCLSAS